MLVKDALKLAIKNLQDFSSSPALDARILLCRALSINLEQLILSSDDRFPADKLSIFWQYIERKIQLEPMAYILGMQEFYGLDFLVNHHVLIPRPETEMIIDLTINLLRNMKNVNIRPLENSLIKEQVQGAYGAENRSVHKAHEDLSTGATRQLPLVVEFPGWSILELGTGSGVIPICLAKNLPHNTTITATDISLNALEVAHQNALMHDVKNITFLQSDWFDNIKPQKFDIIISNPPYISESEISLVSDSTHLYEPHLALYAQKNGLDNYYIIASKAAKYLNKDGKIILEIGYRQAEEVSKIFTAQGFHNISLIKDYSGHPRNLVIRR